MKTCLCGDRMRSAVLVAVALFGTLFAAPAMAETLLRARLNADIVSTMPGMRRDENTDAVLLHVVEGLVATRENGEVGPLLAKSWTLSPDGRVYTFSLREGVTFHNGVKLTSADVAWSLRWYLNPENHWRCLASLSGEIAKISSITTPDPMTVQITLDRSAPLFLKTLSRNDCGGTGILQRASVADDGRTWIKPIGTGPFMLGEWKHGNYIELLRFAHYAALPGDPDGNTGGKHALVDRIHFLIIPDSSAAAAALLRGNLDVMDALDTDQLAVVERDPTVRIAGVPTLDCYAVLLQTDDALLKDYRIRRALALTLDVVGLARAATDGTALPDSSPVPAASPFHGPAERVFLGPDLPEARRLLREAGYKGQRITLVANRRYPEMFNAAVLVQAMARQAGINLEIQMADWASTVALYGSGSYQGLIFGFSAKLDPAFNFDLLIGDKKKDPRKVWDSQAARTLYADAVQATGDTARQAAFDSLNAAFLQELPAIILFNSRRFSAWRGNVYGLKPWPAAQQRLWNVGLRK
jgi:peptide/nickel transport system substrate-binding protein